jgi:hypothetical protein
MTTGAQKKEELLCISFFKAEEEKHLQIQKHQAFYEQGFLKSIGSIV